MTNIALGIDVDTRDVTAADAAFDKLEGRLKVVQGGFGATGRAAEGAGRGIRAVGDASHQSASRTAAAVDQYRKMAAVWASLGTLAGGIVVGGMIRLSDQYTEITNKLRVIAGDQTHVNALFEQLLDVANRTRSPIDAMAQLYQRASMAAKDLGASQSDLISFTENIGKALAMQGGSAESARGALLQLSQALGGGIVRAEEFNSILEGAYPIAQAAARGIEAAGGSVARLRSLVIEGKVSSNEFFQAILSQTDELEAAFGKTVPTIGGAMTVLRNSMVELASETQGVMGVLAQGILFVGENLERLATYAATAAVIFGARLAAGIVASAVATGTLAGALRVLRAALISTGIGALVVVAGELVFQFLKLVEATGGWGEALSLLGEVASGVWEGIKTSAGAIGPALGAVWASVKVTFFDLVASLAIKWAGFLELLNIDSAGASAFANAAIQAMGAAQNEAATLGEAARGALTSGFDQAAEAVGKLRVQVASSAASIGGASSSAGALGAGLGKAAGAAKKVADELSQAKDVLRDQERAYDQVLGKSNGVATASEFVTAETEKLVDALDKSGISLDEFLKTQGKTRAGYDDMLRKTEKITGQIEAQKKAADALVESLKGVAFGTMTPQEGIGGIFRAITDGAFGKTIDDAFKKAATTLSDVLGDALSGLGKMGLSDFGTAAVGTGIGIAAVGAINGNVQQIGAGIGSAAGGVLGKLAGPAISSAIGGSLGAALGAAAGPIGMVLGSLAGTFISKIFDNKSTWKSADVTAFAGTTYATDTSVRFNTANENASPVARAAMVGTIRLLENFDVELAEYVEALGGTVEKGTKLAVDQSKALKAITGYAKEFDAPRDGRSEQAAAEIAAKVSEIMGLAATIAQEAGPALTAAQVAWREVQEKFSAENVAILRSLGFTAKKIHDAQRDIRRDLAMDFNKEMLDSVVDTGRATKAQLDQWKAYELRTLQERYVAAWRAAKEIGASTAFVSASFAAQKADIVEKYQGMVDDLSKSGLDGVIDKITASIGALTTKLTGLESERAEVLTELTKRAEAARNAEKTLADARAGLAVSSLAPGGPMDQLRALQSQFDAAITAARGGDTGAASTAASLAQSLLQQGQQVYASGGSYSALFKSVNTALAGAQGSFGSGASAIEARLDAATFVKTTEKSTSALLLALSTLNTSIQKVEAQIAAQNKQLAAAQQKSRVA